ncbi:MAG: ubiquinone/menaquinone biosynthesis methyltransferase [Actinobacteria bacterium]|nr:ubiquinone/menaquinone biosynthesis methyltransferase [Actinomycetota bacterium]
MFDRVAPVYDAMNRLMTAGLDQGWRRAAARAIVRPGDRVLDLCCGTGDLALAGREAGGDVTAVDFSARMLERARSKSSEIVWLEADALHLPLVDASFDAVTIGFGLRNVAGAEQGLAEMRRVLTSGGRVAVLDVTRPRGLLALFYKVWFDALIPAVGKLLPGGAAFTYLPASVRRFPSPHSLAKLMDEAGFEQIRWRLFAGGIVALHTAVAR